MGHLQLTGLHESLHLSEQDWLAVLELARRYGWKGATQDAGALGPWLSATLSLALRAALPDVPRHDALREKYHGDEEDLPGPVNIYEWFSGRHGRDILHRVIRMCDSGVVFITEEG
jgi:hypothetical protein